MGDSLTIGHIAGIRIGINWSWIVVFGLITWSLAASVFPSTNPDLSTGAYWAMAVAAAALFFLSLLAHELGHALQARRENLEIEGITLWLFGGVAKLRGEMPSPGAEFRVAVAGPIVSLVLGVLFVGVAQLGLPEALDAVAAWLGYVNLALLAFNLLPAVPLDGGRILHAALWRRAGDIVPATKQSTAVSRVLAFGLIAAGIALMVLASAFSGLWLVFIGWFVLQAAAAESRWILARHALRGLRVGDLMVPSPATVPPGLTIDAFMDVVGLHHYTTYPVVEDGHPVGLLPFRCVAEVPRQEWAIRTVGDCMLPLDRVPVLKQEDDLAEAASALSEGGLNRGLVLDDGSLAGLLSLTDVVQALELQRLHGGRA